MNTLTLRSVHSSWPDREFYGHLKRITCCELSTHAEFALSGSEDYTIRIWNLNQNEQMSKINNICLSENRTFLAVSTNDKVTLWDTKNCLSVGVIDTYQAVVSVEDSGDHVITSGYRNELIYWSRSDTGWSQKKVSVPPRQLAQVSKINSLDICPDGSLTAAVERDGILMIHQNFDQSKPIAELLFDDSLQQCYWISTEHLVVHGLRGLYWLKFRHGS
ncbi:hypothetical protein EYB53_024705 [Candidatus Chloroploca sp. M-50]|uniref:Uncharacterized protein n=1 Tax=Candidatus Chloroploca mongolica TaxID=2528176 RepID=A0ABS4DHN6_9CHLR|nr:hypothetical protein [Candidatus Chloroploca mongolica]MBP1468932.1 hypothetical protein [Candidatus Chloroploca mongolica]